MKQRRLFAASMAALVAAAWLAADAAAQPAADASRISDGIVKIGLILDLSGPYWR